MTDSVVIGDATLYCGDNLAVLPTLPDASVDAVVTDPPYNVGLKYTTHNDQKADYEEWCRDWFAELKRVCVGPILISCGIVNLGMWHRIEQPRWCLCWWKPASTCRSAVGFNNWEPVLLYGSGWARNGCDVIRTTEQAALPVNHRAKPIDHPCPKPVEWAAKQLRWFVEAGAVVLDPFLGSGTTALACAAEGRRCVGIEIDPGYFDVACRRLRAEEAKAPLFAEAT